MSKLYTGAEIVFKCLEDQEVEYIFGYPGGAVLPIMMNLKIIHQLNIYLLDMSKERAMQQRVMQDHQASPE